MQLFEFTTALFNQPWKWTKFTRTDKTKNFFMTSRFMAIAFPLQALPLNHIKINMPAAMNFWQGFIRQRFNKVPFWMRLRGSVKKQKEKTAMAKVSNKQVESFAKSHGFEARSVKESLNFYPEETIKEIKQWEKMTK